MWRQTGAIHMTSKLRWRRRAVAIAGTALLAISLAACSSNSAPEPERGGTFTAALSGDVLNLDTANCVPIVYCSVAYSTLIYLAPDGTFQPSLATSWEWTDDTRTTLRLTLRDGAKFADGTPITGEAVAASFTSYLTAPGPFAALSYPMAGAAAAGENQVDITFAEPLTDYFAYYLLSGPNGVSYVVSPDAAANRMLMAEDTAGSGPYMLDPAQTTKGVEYVYVPNPEFFNQDAIMYDKVVLKPMMDPTARVNAILSGQVTWASNIPPTDVQSVADAGLQTSVGPLGAFAALGLLARDSGPLADIKVRQALALATPRADIAAALFGESAVPTSSFIPEGAEGYNSADTDLYDLDVAQAKQLLADAGYADGFTMTALDPAFFDPGSLVGQALQTAYAEIGVTLELTPFDGGPGETAMQMGMYDSVVLTSGANGIFQGIYALFRSGMPMGGLINPKNLPLDDELVAAMAAAATNSDPAQQVELSKAVTARLDELVYAVPIASIPTVQAVGAKVVNVPQQYFSIEANPFAPVTKDAWAGGAVSAK